MRQCVEVGRKPRNYPAGGVRVATLYQSPFTLLADRRLLCFSRVLQPTGDDRAEWEVPLHRTPEMSWLGRRVFGLEPWDN